MRLEHEDRSHRRYEHNGEYIEVRPLLRGRRAEMTWEAFNMREVGDASIRMVTEGLLRELERDGYEPFTDVDLTTERFDFVFYLYDDDGRPLVGDDGEYVIDPEHPDPLPMVRILVEVGCWPPAPEVPS